MQESLLTIATRHQSHFERLKSAEVAKFDTFLVSMDKDIRDTLTRGGKELDRKAMKAQLKQVAAIVSGNMDKYEMVWTDSIADVASYEAGFEQRSLEKVVDGVNFKLPSDAQIMTAVTLKPIAGMGGKTMKAAFKGFSKDETARITNVIQLGYAEGQTTNEIITRVRGTKAAGWRDGALAVLKRQQEMIARTVLQHASTQAREEVWKNNSNVIDRVQWSATLDAKTGSADAALDGQSFPLDKGPRPPLHPNCRCAIVAVLKKEFAFLSKGRTRSARDPVTGKIGHVKKKSYYSWLKDQPAKVQDSIIGPSRGKLLRNGGISSERFAELQIGKNFEPLSLDKMRNLDPVAFDKAGL